MVEGFVQVAPDSTGAKMRTRERTVGANAIEEQYVIAQPHERVTVARAYVASWRQWSRASTAQPIFTLWNGGANIVSVRRLTLECSQNPPAAAAAAGGAPWARSYRITAAPTGGAAMAKIQQDTTETTGAGVVATSDMASDTALAGTALAFTPNSTSPLWEQSLPRYTNTAPNTWETPSLLNLLPDDPALQQEDPLFLRPSQGIGVRAEAQAAMVLQTAAGAAGGYYFMVKCAFAEFTLP